MTANLCKIRPLAKIIRTGKMPIPQEKINLVGWAGEPVPSIDEKDFCKRSNYKRKLKFL